MMMTVIALILTVQSMDTVSLGATVGWQRDLGGQDFALLLSEADIAKNPRWRAGNDNPPLSAGAAIRSARLLARQAVPSVKPEVWRVQAVTLTQILPPDGWVYVVGLKSVPTCAGSPNTCGQPLIFNVIVLMSGQAVSPRFALKAPEPTPSN
jgi:hypothetical protein